jgi:hypothetical protein
LERIDIMSIEIKNQDLSNLLDVIGYQKLSSEKQLKIKELIKKVIKKYREGNSEGAYVNLGACLTALNCGVLDESAQKEIKENLWDLIQRESGYSVKDFNFEFVGGFCNALKESVTTGSDISGPDSNRVGDAYNRVKGKDGIYRNTPKKRDYDPDENEIIKKLNAIRKMFKDRKGDLTIDDIKKVLTQESKEQQLSALQILQEAEVMLKNQNDAGASEKQIIDYYLNESSPITSTFSHNAWSGYRYVKLTKTGVVIHSNTFLAMPGTVLSQEKQDELKSIGIQITIND